MHQDLQTLSQREVEVLQLLLAGHDAKSIARLLDLSVHAVNERLRHARRKLGVSSSREAARLWATSESQPPNFFVAKEFGTHKTIGDKIFGISERRSASHPTGASRHEGGKLPSRWIAGGALAMTLLLATMISAPQLGGGMAEQAELTRPVAEISPSEAPMLAQASMDLMPIADTNRDGLVSEEEYRIFSENGWTVVAKGASSVVLAELDQNSQMAFVGIMPNADGVITRQMYVDAIPGRFRMFDRNADNALSADELNGRAFSGLAPPPRA